MVTTETPPATPFAPTNGSTKLTPVAWVEALPPEDREDILIALLKQLVAANGRQGRISVEKNGEYVGFFISADAEARWAERVVPKLSPEQLAEFDRRAREAKAVPMRELIEGLNPSAIPPQTPGS